MLANSPISLSVCVVVPQGACPNWRADLLAALVELEDVSLTVIQFSDDKVPASRRGKLFRRWKRFDQAAFRSKIPGGRCSEDICAPEDAVEGSQSGLVAASFDSIAGLVSTLNDSESVDVVIWLLPERPPASLLKSVQFGVWSLQNSTFESVGYREVVDLRPITASRLLRLGVGPHDDVVLSEAFAATDLLSLSRSLRAVRAKDQRLLLSMLQRVARARSSPPAISELAEAHLTRPVPGALGLLTGLLRIYTRYALSLLTRRFYFNHWQIAYRRGGDRLSPDNLELFAPPHKGYWADPFIANWKDQTALFFEELPEGSENGNIVVSNFSNNGAPGAPQTIISRDYHLSYPFLFEYEGDLFLTLESAAANKVEAFRCIEFPLRWAPQKIFLDGLKAYDPTLIEYAGRWWMFVSIEADGNSSADELHLFYADNPFAEWTPHPMNPVNCDVRSARPAGALFEKEGCLHRPAQDCSVRYGYALSIQKVLCMTIDDYQEETVQRILPDWHARSWGTHTVNQAAGITVYDAYARCRK